MATADAQSARDEMQQTIRQYLSDRSSSARVRRTMEQDGGFDRALWSGLSALGAQGCAVPVELGGLGLGQVELGLVMEETGRALACVPLLSSAALAGNLLLLSDDSEAVAELLPGIADGSKIGTVAWMEAARWDIERMSCRADQAGGWTLDGVKRHVLNPGVADIMLVVAATSEGPGVFAVDPRADGVTIRPYDALDQTRPMGHVALRQAPARLVGTLGASTEWISRALHLGTIALAAEQLGGAERCLDAATDYAMTRVQFGRVIGSFQVLKHKLADMLISVETARSAVWYALRCADGFGGSEELSMAASLAKAQASTAFSECAAESLQIHGGMGFTWESDVHLYLKRAKSTEVLLGSPTEHRQLLARWIGL